MSGGHFDYQEYKIKEISESIQHVLENQGKVYDENPTFGDGKEPTYPKNIQAEFKKGIEHLNKAYIYAKRIDYLLCGDDGEESFIRRLKEELDELAYITNKRSKRT